MWSGFQPSNRRFSFEEWQAERRRQGLVRPPKPPRAAPPIAKVSEDMAAGVHISSREGGLLKAAAKIKEPPGGGAGIGLAITGIAVAALTTRKMFRDSEGSATPTSLDRRKSSRRGSRAMSKSL